MYYNDQVYSIVYMIMVWNNDFLNITKIVWSYSETKDDRDRQTDRHEDYETLYRVADMKTFIWQSLIKMVDFYIDFTSF